MKFEPGTRVQFSPGEKTPSDVSFCSVARAMIDAHYLGTSGPQVGSEVMADFPGHMLSCDKCQQYELATRTGSGGYH